MARGENFVDATLVSGADEREDSRSFVLFDFDQDGWQDIGLISVGQPRLRLLRNELKDRFADHRSVEIRLVGGSQDAKPTLEWSSRDAYGAVVMVETAETTRKFQLACSEGLASQNSRRIHIGLGKSPQIVRLTVRWPSGKTSELSDIAAGRTVTVLERESK